jgi:hypothetical protein
MCDGFWRNIRITQEQAKPDIALNMAVIFCSPPMPAPDPFAASEQNCLTLVNVSSAGRVAPLAWHTQP